MNHRAPARGLTPYAFSAAAIASNVCPAALLHGPCSASSTTESTKIPRNCGLRRVFIEIAFSPTRPWSRTRVRLLCSRPHPAPGAVSWPGGMNVQPTPAGATTGRFRAKNGHSTWDSAGTFQPRMFAAWSGAQYALPPEAPAAGRISEHLALLSRRSLEQNQADSLQDPCPSYDSALVCERRRASKS